MNFCILPKLLHLNAEVGYEYRSFSIRQVQFSLISTTRIALEELESLIYQRKYFVLHAPRQTGKTSCLLALHDYLNARGEFYAVYANVEVGQASRNNVEEVNRNVVSARSPCVFPTPFTGKSSSAN